MQIDFDQYVEYKTTQGIFSVPPEAHTLDNPLTLEAVRDGYTNAIALGRTPTLDAGTFRQAAADVYHADVLEAEVSADPVQTFDRLAWVRSRPEWRVGATFAAEEVLLYPADNNLYQAVIAHTVQAANWTPELRTLYRRYYHLDEVPEWTQPIGASDAWRIGAKVAYLGKEWESLIDFNTTVPGSDPRWWKDLSAPQTEEWAVGVAYKVNDQVTYQGSTYRCLQAHTSLAGWQPPNVPALWTLV